MLSIIQDIIGGKTRNKTPPYHATRGEVLRRAQAAGKSKEDIRRELNDLYHAGKISYGREINDYYLTMKG